MFEASFIEKLIAGLLVYVFFLWSCDIQVPTAKEAPEYERNHAQIKKFVLGGCSALAAIWLLFDVITNISLFMYFFSQLHIHIGGQL